MYNKRKKKKKKLQNKYVKFNGDRENKRKKI